MMVWLWMAVIVGPAWGQSSSLYLAPVEVEPVTGPNVRGMPTPLSPAIRRTSFAAVQVPEPREFALNDLVTIIIRESTTADSEATLDTDKQSSIDAKVSDFPNLRLLDEFVGLVMANDLQDDPTVGVNFKSKFKGEGEYSRRDSFTSRVTARIIDVKPNGTLVLEARKYIKSDKETLDMVLTGTCRQEDIAADNTVLSTQLYDLRLVKEHSGEVRKATKKGLLTKFFETIVNF